MRPVVSRTSLKVALVGACVAIAPAGLAGPAVARSSASGAYPAGPLGTSYEAWAARWWQWALSQPASTNPLTDTTGEFCAQAQRGRMWFLAGTTGGPAVTRRCTVPAGKSLLFPIVNSFSGATPTDPTKEKTEGFQRDKISNVAAATGLTLRVDGRRIRGLRRYLEHSVVFRVVLPADNILGADASSQ